MPTDFSAPSFARLKLTVAHSPLPLVILFHDLLRSTMNEVQRL